MHPFDASFNAAISTINNDVVTGYTWNFGDNSTGHSTTSSIDHRYNNAGSYDVSLTVTTQQGCTATRTFQQLVKTGTAPQNVSFYRHPHGRLRGHQHTPAGIGDQRKQLPLGFWRWHDAGRARA